MLAGSDAIYDIVQLVPLEDTFIMAEAPRCSAPGRIAGRRQRDLWNVPLQRLALGKVDCLGARYVSDNR